MTEWGVSVTECVCVTEWGCECDRVGCECDSGGVSVTEWGVSATEWGCECDSVMMCRGCDCVRVTLWVGVNTRE